MQHRQNYSPDQTQFQGRLVNDTFFSGADELVRQVYSFRGSLDNLALKASTRYTYCCRLRQLLKYIEKHELTLGQSRLTPVQVLLAFLQAAKSNGRLKASSLRNFVSTFELLARHAGYALPPEFAQLAHGHAQSIVTSASLPACDLELVKAVARQSQCPRNLAIVLLLLNVPIRIGQLRLLKVGDLLWDGQNVVVRVVGVRAVHHTGNAELTDALRMWLAYRRHLPNAASSDYLFPGPGSEPVVVSTIRWALQKIGWRAGLQLTPRSLGKSGRR